MIGQKWIAMHRMDVFKTRTYHAHIRRSFCAQLARNLRMLREFLQENMT